MLCISRVGNNRAKKSKKRKSLDLTELIPNMPVFLRGGTSCNNNGMGAYEIVRVVRYVDCTIEKVDEIRNTSGPQPDSIYDVPFWEVKKHVE